MIRKAILLACALAGAGLAHARQTQDIDPDLLAYIEGIEEDTGTKRFGRVMLGELEGADATTISVPVDPSSWTFIAVICGPSCEQIDGTAYSASGKEIAKAPMSGSDAVIQVPPGNGATVAVKVDMLVCEWDTCPYAVQTFTRPGS
jgi:hypothetical protein